MVETVDMDSIVATAVASPLAINDYQQFRSSINNSRHILYLGDNAGEIVFDRVLILLRAKCPLAADLLGVSVGDAILKQNPARTKAKGNKDYCKEPRKL